MDRTAPDVAATGALNVAAEHGHEHEAHNAEPPAYGFNILMSRLRNSFLMMMRHLHALSVTQTAARPLRVTRFHNGTPDDEGEEK